MKHQCGGKLVIDEATPPYQDELIYYAIKCAKCGAALGRLSDVCLSSWEKIKNAWRVNP